MYQRLETALSRLIGGEKPIKGTLGYTIDGVYRVTVAENPAKYYVRFADGGGFAQVYHRGRVSPVPDLPVEVGLRQRGQLVILGGDPDRAASCSTARTKSGRTATRAAAGWSFRSTRAC